ncbi:hypothetical protein P4K71_09060 [Bacillus cereus]|uniref:hypothetical protein n=1 Tax=Bacillus TaxID=1386 RepID=UPI0020CFD42D|nr:MULTISPECIES: hypothetical protein [Bacillus]MEB8736533.1 hypothetical protein [Bacillus cereus]MDM5036139.1 hypothetical protein [Bacillus sp. OR-18]MEB8905360.1 hypothetical protein [Bacillus cereus]MEB9922965.1 hypothetical protein [Bacillus cereus]MEB9986137.1 hypothetical protein [Bacillus cereus]
MTEIDVKNINDWNSKKTAEFFISKELFHRYSDLFLDKYNHVEENIKEVISQKIRRIKV